MPMNRREALISTTAMLLVGCKTPTPTPAIVPTVLTPPPTDIPTLDPSLLERLQPHLDTVAACYDGLDLEAVRLVGVEVLAQADPDLLFPPVLGVLELGGDPVAALRTLQLQDFSAIRVLDLQGWTLAQSEGALAAMLVY